MVSAKLFHLAKRKALLAQLQFQRKTIRLPAIEAAKTTRTTYEAFRNRINLDTADYLESKDRLRMAKEKRVSRAKRSSFRNRANIGVKRIEGLVGKNAYVDGDQEQVPLA